MSSTSYRLFVALPLAEEAVAGLEKWASMNKESIPFRKWVHPADYHITLQFLGETAEKQIDPLTKALHGITVPTLTLKLDNFVAFGAPQAPRILAASVSGDVSGLQKLQKEVVRATSTLGFEAEKRAYVPHVTIARKYIGDQPFEKEWLETLPDHLSFEARQFTLMKTNLYQSPMYEVVERFS